MRADLTGKFCMAQPNQPEQRLSRVGAILVHELGRRQAYLGSTIDSVESVRHQAASAISEWMVAADGKLLRKNRTRMLLRKGKSREFGSKVWEPVTDATTGDLRQACLHTPETGAAECMV